jgi:serine/threonine protein kinase
MNEKDFFEQFLYDSEKDLLGSGGFGTVYRAYDRLKNRYVAIKISQVKDIFGKFTLLNEVKLSQEIDDHANVARYELGLRVKHPFPVDYAVMAYYEEGNLDMLLRKKHGVLTKQEQYEIVEGLLEGIAHLHTENVIHRDLKLANILMLRTKQGQWRPKIADFGLSRQMDTYDASIANSAIGITIAYAAPEQIENKPIRKNVDLWAIGVIIYRILTGEMPFAHIEGADPTSATVEMSRKITQVQLPERLEILPEPYQSIVKRCWVKDIKDRAQTAGELLLILRNQNPLAAVGANEIASTPSVIEPERASSKPVVQDEASAETQIISSAPAIWETPSVPKVAAIEKKEIFVDDATSLERFNIVEEQTDKTVIDKDSAAHKSVAVAKANSKSSNQTGSSNRTAMFIGAGVLCLLLGWFVFGRNTQPKPTDTSTTTAPIDTPKVPETIANTTPKAPDLPKNPPVVANTPATNVPKKEETAPATPVQTPSPAPAKPTASRPSGPVDKAGDFVLKLSCCCHQMTGGTVTVSNFIIEPDGHVSTTGNTNVRIVNNGKTLSETGECQEKILSVFKKYYKWSSRGSSYTMGGYDIEY